MAYLNQGYLPGDVQHSNYRERLSTSTKRSRHVTYSSSGGSGSSLASFARNSFASSMTSWQSQRNSIDHQCFAEKCSLTEESQIQLNNDLNHEKYDKNVHHHKGKNDPAGQSGLSAFIDEVLGECDFPALPKTPKSATEEMDLLDCYTQSPSPLPACHSLIVPKEKLDFIMMSESAAANNCIENSPASTARIPQYDAAIAADDRDSHEEEEKDAEGQDGYIILGPPLEYKNFSCKESCNSSQDSNSLSRRSSAHLSSSRSTKSSGSFDSGLKSPISSFSLRKTLGTKYNKSSNIPGKKQVVSIPYNFVHVNHIDTGRDFGPAGRDIQLSSFPSIRPEQQQRPSLNHSKSQPLLGDVGFGNNWRRLFSRKAQST